MDFIIPEKIYGVIGHPLTQTLSPLVHNIGFRTLGFAGAYFAWPVAEADLPRFVDAMRLLPISGCSVTIPHKIAIMPLLDEIDEPAKLAGAVNTLYWREGKLVGENTDVAGFLAPLKNFDIAASSVLLLGAGGAAHAVTSGLKMLDCKNVRIASMDNNQYRLAEHMGFQAIAWDDRYREPAQVVINATPVGMKGALVEQTPYDFGKAPVREGGLAYDLVYNPLQTRFLREALACGREAVSGLEMFYWQADGQFMHWTGKSLPIQARNALIEQLSARAE